MKTANALILEAYRQDLIDRINIKVKVEDIVEDLGGIRYVVKKVSKNYYDVADFDKSKAAKNWLADQREMGRDTTQFVWVAVEGEGKKKHVFVYGDEGVTKVLDAQFKVQDVDYVKENKDILDGYKAVVEDKLPIEKPESKEEEGDEEHLDAVVHAEHEASETPEEEQAEHEGEIDPNAEVTTDADPLYSDNTDNVPTASEVEQQNTENPENIEDTTEITSETEEDDSTTSETDEELEEKKKIKDTDEEEEEEEELDEKRKVKDEEDEEENEDEEDVVEESVKLPRSPVVPKPQDKTKKVVKEIKPAKAAGKSIKTGKYEYKSQGFQKLDVSKSKSGTAKTNKALVKKIKSNKKIKEAVTTNPRELERQINEAYFEVLNQK